VTSTAAPAPDRSLRPSDAFSWYLERDPMLRIPVVVVVLLDKEPDRETLRRRVSDAVRHVPELAQTVFVPPLRLAPPRWTRAASVDLDWHLREVAAAPLYDDAAVLDIARIEATTPFDVQRPLWTVTLVSGLNQGRAALILRFHHALTDGVGGVALATELFDLERTPTLGATPRDLPVPGARHPLRDALSEQALHGLRVAVTTPLAALHMGLAAVRHPRSAWDTVTSVTRTVAPVRTTLSPLLRDRGLPRSLHALEVPFADLHRVAQSQGCTVNDAFLTAVARGLRLHHAAHGLDLPSIRVTMPIDLRAPGDPPAGNRITLMRFTVPTGGADVGASLRAVRAVAQARRGERSLPHTQSIASALNLLPSQVVGSMLKHVEVVASDVPGPPVPLFAAGARVMGWQVFGPTTGAALNATLMSYEGTCFVGLNIDSSAVADPAQLAACVRDGFEELLTWGATR
jgi:diacylglycerol O-acyltransferase